MEIHRSPTGREPQQMKKIIRKFKDLKYRYKLTILIIIASLIPVAIVSMYMQSGTLRLLRDNEADNLRETLDQSVNTLENQVEIYGNLINYLSYSQDLRTIVDTEYASDYEAYLEYTEVADPLFTMPQIYHKEIQKITLYAENIKVEHGNTLAPLSSAETEFWYSYLEPTEKVQWFVNRGSNREIIASRKFYNDEGITAVLTITLDYKRILEPFCNLIKENTGGTIYDQHGTTVYSGYSMDEDYRPSEAESEKYIKNNYAYSVKEMKDTGWKFYLYRPTKEMTRSANHLMARNFPILGICALLILMLGYLFSKGMVRRLERLTENMNQINLGPREVTIQSDSMDEVGVLIRTFRRMMKEINKLISEVYESKIELQKTEMRALQAQINPHFLYNSLSIINWKALEADEEEISQVTLALSTFYRTSLNRGETMTTMGNELNNIKAYLHIQLIMHDDNFKVVEDIDSDTLDYQVPKLILQPLVENAIEHGLDTSEKDDKILWITISQDENTLSISVRDNGNGMKQERADQITTYHSKGYGVRNVNDRIVLLYGEEYRIQVNSDEGEGTCVEIRIPKNTGGLIHDEA